MKIANPYINYRIYTQKANEAMRGYAREQVKSLSRLHQRLNNDDEFINREFRKEWVRKKYFIPQNLKSINRKYAKLISHISQYFECYAVWHRQLYLNTNFVIDGIITFGYTIDLLLAHHYIAKTINNLEALRENEREKFRVTRIKRRRKGLNKLKKHASTRATEVHERELKRIEKQWYYMLQTRKFHKEHDYKMDYIFGIMQQKIELKPKNWKVAKTNPKLHHFIAPTKKFYDKRIILWQEKKQKK